MRRGGILGQRRSAVPFLRVRLHPLWLIPVFLIGSWYGPFAGERGVRYTGPAYNENEDYDRSFLPPDAPPLNNIGDEEGGGGGGGGAPVNARSLDYGSSTAVSGSLSSSDSELGWNAVNSVPGAPSYFGELDGYLYFPPHAPLVSVKVPSAPATKSFRETNPYQLHKHKDVKGAVGGIVAALGLGGKQQQQQQQQQEFKRPVSPPWPLPNPQKGPFAKRTGDQLVAFAPPPAPPQPARKGAPPANAPKHVQAGAAAAKKRPAVERDERGHILGANAAAARRAALEGIPFKPKPPAELIMDEAREMAAERKAVLEAEAKRRQQILLKANKEQDKPAPAAGAAKVGFGANNPQVNARKEAAAAREKAIEQLLREDPRDAKLLDDVLLDLEEADYEAELAAEDDDWVNDLVLPARLTEYERSFLSKEDLAVVDQYEAEMGRGLGQKAKKQGGDSKDDSDDKQRKAAARGQHHAAPAKIQVHDEDSDAQQQQKEGKGKAKAAPEKKQPRRAPAAQVLLNRARNKLPGDEPINKKVVADADDKEEHLIGGAAGAAVARGRPVDGRNRWRRSFEAEEPLDDQGAQQDWSTGESEPAEGNADSVWSTNDAPRADSALPVLSQERPGSSGDNGHDLKAEPKDEEEDQRMRRIRKRSVTDERPPSVDAVKGGKLHPISWLIKTAEERWSRLVSHQSQTLEQAVREYERRYKRRPPIGFDKWWKYAMENRVVLVDEYDQIMDDLEPFFALPASDINMRANAIMSDTKNGLYADSFTVVLKDGDVMAKGAHKSSPRAEDTMDLMSEFSDMLPDMRIPFAAGNGGQVLISGEAREVHVEAARAGEELTHAETLMTYETNDFSSFISICDPYSAARNRTLGLDAGVTPYAPSFVSIEHAQAMDYCKHPEIQALNGYTSWSGSKTHLLHPRFAPTKLASEADILTPAIDEFFVDPGPAEAWSRKWHNKVLWRGATLGTYRQAGVNWRQSQRDRLVALANNNNGTRQVRFADAKAGDLVRRFEAPTKDVNAFYFDVAFTGAPTHSEQADGSCETLLHEYRFQQPLAKSASNSYKYVLDVDGNGWSPDFRRLLQIGSVVFKSTIFPEWWSKRIMPWYHYVPIKSDYSDLHDVAAYFIGAPDGTGAHDGDAEKIARQGKQWARDHWREVDLAAYQFRLLLEYARLLNRRADDPHDFIL